MNVTILNVVSYFDGKLKRYTCAVTYIEGQVTETRTQYYPASSLNPAWRMVACSGRKGREITGITNKTYRAFVRFYQTREWENPVPYTWRGHAFPANATFPLETTNVIVKLSCGCGAETPCPGYELRESIECRFGHGLQRIIVIESTEPIAKNRTTGAGSSVKCEWCGTLFSGHGQFCPPCEKEVEFETEAQAYAIAHGEEF